MRRASKFAKDLPQQVTIDGVESLCKDGRHVMIQKAPPLIWIRVFQCKGFRDIVLLPPCSAQYCFMLIDVGDEGRQTPSIW